MAIGREDYRERKEARIDRLNAKAGRAASESEAAYQQASAIADRIPMGQPILVGHHSERHARRDQALIERNMDRSVEAGKQADYYASRARAAASNKAISSDDPEALIKLQDKLDRLQELQERDKKLNAYYRKHKTMKGFPDFSDEKAARMDAAIAEQPERLRRPVPAWALSNRNAEISRVKKRIEALHTVDAMEDVEIGFNGGVIVSNSDVNRVQVIFDGKPDADMRRALKGIGFRWAPSEGAWQAQRTPANLQKAKDLMGGVQDGK